MALTLNAETKVDIMARDDKPRFKVSTPQKSVTLEAESYSAMMQWVLTLRGVTFMDPGMNMAQFKILTVLGRGHYGKVMLVQKKDTGEFFAIKTVRKDRLARSNKLQTIMNERNVLMKAHHPFIISMKFAFQTSRKFYFGMEYAPGGEMFSLQRKLKKLPPNKVRIYIAEMVLAIEYLHSKGIIYRDIKPENIMFDLSGHLKLCDFGLAKEIGDELTQSFVGTPEYTAPEMVLKQPYGKPVDWWGIGVLTYDLMCGETPFYHESTKEMYYSIVNKQPSFPKEMDTVTRTFIMTLLAKNPAERPDAEGIKAHRFFEGLDWKALLEKKIDPPFVPNINPIKPENFGSEFLNEKALDSYCPPPAGDDDLHIAGFSVAYLDPCEQRGVSAHPSLEQMLGLEAVSPSEMPGLDGISLV